MACSLDPRHKCLAAVDRGEAVAAAGRRSGVAAAAPFRRPARRRRTGDVAADKPGPSGPAEPAAAGPTRPETGTDRRPGTVLREPAGRTGVPVAPGAIGRRLRRMGCRPEESPRSPPVAGVAEAVESAGRTARCLPACGPDPDPDPTGKSWSEVRTAVRAAAARTAEDLRQAVGDAWKTVAAEDCPHWCRHCGHTQ